MRRSGSGPSLLAGLIMVTVAWAPAPGLAQDEEAVAPLADALWNPPVEVVQARLVEKARAVELVALFGVIPSDPFLVYLPLGLRAAYHLRERWAVEVSFEYYLSVDTGLRDYLQANDAELRARIRDHQRLRAHVSLLFAPVYGKLAAGRSIVHFDGYLGLGTGLVHTAAVTELVPAAVAPDVHLVIGLRAFLGARFLVRLELRQFLYPRSEEGGGGVGSASEIGLCAGVLLGGRR